MEVGLGLGLGGSGEGVRVRRRKRSSRRRATAVGVISDDRVMASESLVDGVFEKSHDGPLGRPVGEEGTHLVGTFVAPDLGSSRPGLEDLGPHSGGEGHVEGVEGLRRARDPQPYEGVLSMGSIGKGGRVDSSEGSEVRPRIEPHIDRVGGSSELGVGRGQGTPCPVFFCPMPVN